MDKNDTVKNQSADVNRGLSTKSKKEFKGISYGQIGLLALAFIFGIIVVLICQNITKSENITFSTTSLVSFLFSIALAGASIVLAITAISISKTSERAMIDRSDESIRLQNEVFMKTTDALQRIESSTGVTEKRIEDIISGRAGDISQRIVEHAIGDKLVPKRSRSQLEAEVKKSIVNELSEEKRKEREAIMLKREKGKKEAMNTYRKFQKAALLAVANSPNVVVEKVGEGYFAKEGEELVDGVFEVNGKKFGMSTFSNAKILHDYFLAGFTGFINDSAHEISNGTFERVFLVFNDELEKDNEFSIEFTQTTSLLKENIVDKIFIISGSPKEISQKIIDTFK